VTADPSLAGSYWRCTRRTGAMTDFPRNANLVSVVDPDAWETVPCA
jgi:hypothetical protein